jgi:hypothetical protein
VLHSEKNNPLNHIYSHGTKILNLCEQVAASLKGKTRGISLVVISKGWKFNDGFEDSAY